MIDSSAFIAPGVAVLGDVTLGPESSMWYNAGASRRHGPDCDRREDQHSRPDYGARGRGRAVHHRAPGGCVSSGGSARLPDADDCLIGMGSIVLNGVRIGAGSVTGAGTLVTEHTEIPPDSLGLGMPARVVRKVDAELRLRMQSTWEHYVQLASRHRAGEVQRHPETEIVYL